MPITKNEICGAAAATLMLLGGLGLMTRGSSGYSTNNFKECLNKSPSICEPVKARQDQAVTEGVVGIVAIVAGTVTAYKTYFKD